MPTTIVTDTPTATPITFAGLGVATIIENFTGTPIPGVMVVRVDTRSMVQDELLRCEVYLSGGDYLVAQEIQLPQPAAWGVDFGPFVLPTGDAEPEIGLLLSAGSTTGEIDNFDIIRIYDV